MKFVRTILAFILAVATTYGVAVVFLTQQVIEKRAAIGAVYTRDQQFTTLVDNLIGLASAYSTVLSIALLLGFLIAAGVKRILKPLAPIAFPIGGAAAVYTAIFLIEKYRRPAAAPSPWKAPEALLAWGCRVLPVLLAVWFSR